MLLDTNAVIFIARDPERLSPRARQAYQEAEQVVVSVVSFWEIAIKAGRRNLDLPASFDAFVRHWQSAQGVEIVPITTAPLRYLISLPPIHGDPFDRLLVAQTIELDADLLSSDTTLDAYDITRIW